MIPDFEQGFDVVRRFISEEGEIAASDAGVGKALIALSTLTLRSFDIAVNIIFSKNFTQEPKTRSQMSFRIKTAKR